MDQNPQADIETGTKDETYDIIAVLYHALQGAENCEIYAEDAVDDPELRQFFEQAGDQQRQVAEQGKRLLQSRLVRGDQASAGEGSAFSQFGSSTPDTGGAGPGTGSTAPSATETLPDQFGGGGSPRHTQTNPSGEGTSGF